MLRTSIFLSILLCTLSCSTSTKALEKGQNKKAMRLAKSGIKKSKDLEKNIAIFNTASQKEIDKVLQDNAHKASSTSVSEWKSVQSNYYDLLLNIGEANQLTGGQISEPYDRLCEYKTELDYKIAEHYYQEAEVLMASFHEEKDKGLARQAYSFYHSAQEYGAESYHDDISEKMAYCVENGRVYFIADDYSPRETTFFKPLPNDATYEADCIFSVSRSGYSVSEDKDESKETHEEKIKVGKETIKDTTGAIRYKTIYETAVAHETTVEVTKTLTTTTWINVKNNTGHCHVRSSSFTTEVSDSYEEVSLTGDKRAYPSSVNECSGEPTFFMSNLIDELNSEVETKLR